MVIEAKIIALSIMFLLFVLFVAFASKEQKQKKHKGSPKRGAEYEKCVAKYLKKHGYWRIKITKASGDFGVDITARRGLFKKFAIQCKYYSTPVGISAVQEVVAGMKLYKCNRTMVVSNSHFTKQAHTLAEQNNVILVSGVR